MIIPATQQDGQQIHAITTCAGVFDAEECDCVQELWDEYMQKGPQASGYNFLVDREGEHITGYACYGPRALTNGTYDLYWIAVNPADRRKGVGQALLRAVEQTVCAEGGRLLVVETSGMEKYVPTRAFYAASGYLQEATLRDFYKPGDDLTIFTKHLV